MARRSFSFPPLKLTRRPAFSASVKKLHQGVRDVLTLPGQSQENIASLSEFPASVCHETETHHCNELTIHEIEAKSSVAGWEAIREGLLTAVTESQGMPSDQICVHCDENPALIRCRQCGPLSYYCLSCFDRGHSRVSFLHAAERWMGDHYIPVLQTHQLDVRPAHMCASKRKVSIACVDEYGIEHSVNFTCCACEALPITLARAQLWPATPHHPRLAFTFGLLDWTEALMLESQVSLNDFCRSLAFRCPLKLQKKTNIYKALIDAFEEYRYVKHEVRHLCYLSPDLDPGNICPACPKGGGKLIYAFDALFGLPRKKAAGQSHREPLHGSLWFCDQLAVDEYMGQSRQSKPIKNDCSNFVAGSALRSNSRYRSLDETALFGCACRHEFPVKFLNLKHGERLGYAVWMLESIIEANLSTDNDLFVMYDIACSLHGHLNASHRADLLEKITLCLPTFHSYGHKVSCQVLFGPRRCSGIGLSDGETMERLWSFLRRFGRMTKEMRPAHRTDVLAHALVYYGIMTKFKLAKLLLLRWERARKVSQVAEETLNRLLPQHSAGDSYLVVQKWISEEVSSYKCSKSVLKPEQWKFLYCRTLQSYFLLRSQILSDDVQSTTHMELASIEKKLQDMEQKLSISSRWKSSGAEYKEVEHALLTNKREQLLLAMWKAAKRRLFLLKLKAKYADGQKIAKRLAKQIAREVKIMKELLLDYNSCCSDDSGCSLSLTSAYDLDFLSTLMTSTHATPEMNSRHEIIEEYFMLMRSREEVELLKVETSNAINFYALKKNVIEAEIQRRSDASDYNVGAKCLLTRLLQDVTKLLHDMQQSYRVMEGPEQTTELQEISSSDSDSDSDGDGDDHEEF